MLLKIKVLRGALAVAATPKENDTRYWLTGVQVAPDGAARGTDGHIAAIVRPRYPDKEEEFPLIPGVDGLDVTRTAAHPLPEAVNLDGETVKRILKAAGPGEKSRRGVPVIRENIQIRPRTEPDVVGSTVSLITTDLENPVVIRARQPEGGSLAAFPNLDRILPKAGDPACAQAVIRLDVLKKLVALVEGVGGTSVLLAMPKPTWFVPPESVPPNSVPREKPHWATWLATRFAVIAPDVLVDGCLMPMEHAAYAAEFPPAPEPEHEPDTRAQAAARGELDDDDLGAYLRDADEEQPA